jgi:26S proteasome regulatory subunit N6
MYGATVPRPPLQVRHCSPCDSTKHVSDSRQCDAQAEIDMQSGVLNAEEKDYKTAYSYFFEAFEQYNNLNASKALPALKCMLLCKIMSNNAEDVAGIIASKSGLKYMGIDLEAMKLVAAARSQSSLEQLKVFMHA